MKYLKYFKTDVDRQNYFSSDDFVTPNVSYAEDTNIVYYSPYDEIIMTSESNPEVMKDLMYCPEALTMGSMTFFIGSG